MKFADATTGSQFFKKVKSSEYDALDSH